jgi:hypothetical protein
VKSIIEEGFIGVDMPPLPDGIWQGVRYLQLTESVCPATSSDTLATWSIPAEGAITTQGNTGRNGIIRWYDPITGRWLSNDPIGISGGLNQYVFCRNNPVNFVDPLGLCTEEDGYWRRSFRQLWYGNLTDDVTLGGTGMQIGTGLIGIDLPGDVRDIFADLGGWEWSWGHAGQTTLDVVGLLPLIGAVKYADEAGALMKSSNKLAKKQVNAVAQEFGLTGTARKDFGTFIEKTKHREGRGGADNFTYEELRQLAEEFRNQ